MIISHQYSLTTGFIPMAEKKVDWESNYSQLHPSTYWVSYVFTFWQKKKVPKSVIEKSNRSRDHSCLVQRSIPKPIEKTFNEFRLLFFLFFSGCHVSRTCRMCFCNNGKVPKSLSSSPGNSCFWEVKMELWSNRLFFPVGLYKLTTKLDVINVNV